MNYSEVPSLDELMAVVRLYGKNPTPSNEFKVRCTLMDVVPHGVPGLVPGTDLAQPAWCPWCRQIVERLCADPAACERAVLVLDEGQAFSDWMAQWPEHSERDRLKMFSAFKAGIAAARGVMACVTPKNDDDALLIDNLFRACLGRDSDAIDRARMALRQRMNELRTNGVPGTEAPSSADAILRELVEAHAEWDAKHWSKRSDPGAADRLLKARRAARDYINTLGVGVVPDADLQAGKEALGAPAYGPVLKNLAEPDPFNPQFVSGFWHGHAAGRKRGAAAGVSVPDGETK